MDTEALVEILGLVIGALCVVIGTLESIRRRIIYDKKREQAREMAAAWERETVEVEALNVEDVLSEAYVILGERMGQE